MNFIQSTLQAVEVGKGQFLSRLIPLLTAVLVVGGAYDLIVYRGLSDAQSMDNAQLARQIAHHQGFTTKFLRPQAVAQLRDYAMSQSLKTGASRDLFPADRFPPGPPRILPDTYNAPGYPCLLAAWFFVTHPDFGETPGAMAASHFYSADRWLPLLNQAFLLMTAVLVFALGRRLFDDRVAWISLLAFLGTDLVWHYTLTALSTTFLMFLVTAMLLCLLEIFCVGEVCFDNEDHAFTAAWGWGCALAFLLAVSCLTRLHLLVLLVPLIFFLSIMPRASWLLCVAIALAVVTSVIPWFWHEYKVSGNILGSNFALVLDGQGVYSGNQIYCMTSIPSYENLFKDALTKESTGFLWHLDHGWNLLGANPLIFIFGTSILHQFKRRRTRLFHWFLFCSAIVLVAANNLGSATPDDMGPWNVLILLFPCMLVMGTAYFFILLDRLNVQMRLLNNLIVTTSVVVIIAPMLLTLTTTPRNYYAFPPYIPPLINEFGQFAQPDEWVTSDMPWATAWYADRASLWLPDTTSDFQNFYDSVCPSGVLLLTPVSWSQPISNFTTGEYKDWLPFVSNNPLPAAFPLSVHTQTGSGGPNYSLWSDRTRWLDEK
jgi:hypothetical protein